VEAHLPKAGDAGAKRLVFNLSVGANAATLRYAVAKKLVFDL
jgi:hypothetical protein